MASIYRLTTLAASHRGGMNAAIDAEIRGIAKTNQKSPYTIANEMVAARLGTALGLPIPAGVIAEHAGSHYYVSLDVSKEGKALPPIIAEDFVAAEPSIAAGCVIFDAWIANSDRHQGNLAYDHAFAPPRASVFDHGHALLGTNPPSGRQRLEAASGHLGCTGDMPLPGNRHVLLDLVSDSGYLMAWVERVEELPSYLIDDAVQEVRALRLLPNDGSADALQGWLHDRRHALRGLVLDNRDEFPAVAQWGLDGDAP